VSERSDRMFAPLGRLPFLESRVDWATEDVTHGYPTDI
jgi:hypothetical protein